MSDDDMTAGETGPDATDPAAVRRPSVDEIVHRIRAMIRDRELEPGEKMGSERGLAAEFGVSRFELRLALTQLESRHEVIRKIGRGGGIVVADDRLERNFNTSESLPVIARRQGFDLRSSVLRAVITPASPSDARLLELGGPAPTIYDITRLRFIDDGPLSVETSHLPADLFPQFPTHDLTQPFYTMFERYYDVHPAVVDETMETVEADARLAELLGVEIGAPVVRVRRITRDTRGRPCERAMDCYRADRIRFTMRHSGYVRLSATRRDGRDEPDGDGGRDGQIGMAGRIGLMGRAGQVGQVGQVGQASQVR
ncbi:GntR family transcriptional regulator [Bifidobacterium sp. DSM 109958]|uniref:GntR family transcriptional regulator n=1 Tax=Bifidobacterium moraviense TaxID=2675323 RepID=A0A7Y0HZH5_9BIFI|nr:GntR family transcriptional regulator [Bifidobacterium sp. DSM 109958]NMN00220.1 GntR family transcriptional regulator [Bifidobacterium sp. DSM 109958]